MLTVCPNLCKHHAVIRRRSYFRDMASCRQYGTKDTGKSQHCVGWAPGNAPGFATLLWYDYLIQTQDDSIKDESVRQRALEIVKRTIQEAGPGGLCSTDLCHILKWETPFYFGEVEAGLDRLKEITTRWIETQEEDGSWCFHPITDRAKTLGNEGDAVLGTCAPTTPTAPQTRTCNW